MNKNAVFITIAGVVISVAGLVAWLVAWIREKREKRNANFDSLEKARKAKADKAKERIQAETTEIINNGSQETSPETIQGE